MAWAQSLQTQAGKDEERAARETNLPIQNWAVRHAGALFLAEIGKLLQEPDKL